MKSQYEVDCLRVYKTPIFLVFRLNSFFIPYISTDARYQNTQYRLSLFPLYYLQAFIDMDNLAQFALPLGWSEGRSSFGRRYYACDRTRTTTWQHPRLGRHVPLGWERVDSLCDGVYYHK
ncbi:unnamed protein product [Protopolystoma xenopodis]|uniref:WW domain-containing protein n=1 Tax=Protopolystoma xenopodis TaxID=117903 RepID=A0A3S5FGE4_9PLAT|nr:unnamed protein product [Protopolystoma xenopodis]